MRVCRKLSSERAGTGYHWRTNRDCGFHLELSFSDHNFQPEKVWKTNGFEARSRSKWAGFEARNKTKQWNWKHNVSSEWTSGQLGPSWWASWCLDCAELLQPHSSKLWKAPLFILTVSLRMCSFLHSLNAFLLAYDSGSSCVPDNLLSNDHKRNIIWRPWKMQSFYWALSGCY